MSNTLENSGVIQATVGAGRFGILRPASVAVGTTPVALFANNTGITGSSSAPVYPAAASFTAVAGGTYRFRYSIYVSVSKSGSSSTSSGTAYLYLKYKIVKHNGSVVTDDITNISASLSSGSGSSSTARNAKCGSVDLSLEEGDVVYFGGYKTNPSSSYYSTTATIYNVAACIDWDNGFQPS